MSSGENKSTVQALINAVSQGDEKTIRRVVADGLVNHNPVPGTPDHGPESVIAASRAFTTGFEDYRAEIRDLIAEGDKVAVRARFTGTHTGGFLGNPPTGGTMSVDALMVFRFEGGRVVERWGQIDFPAIMQQLGLSLPRPQPKVRVA
jgi:predicted ester cyclase